MEKLKMAQGRKMGSKFPPNIQFSLIEAGQQQGAKRKISLLISKFKREEV